MIMICIFFRVTRRTICVPTTISTYDVDVRTINEHIKKIYSDSELEEDSTIRNFRIVQTEGSRQITRDTKHYNLQMIIAVGFKVNN